MLISKNEVKLESLIERHLYENGCVEANVNIHTEHKDVEMFIKADDKRLTISMYDDDFENEDEFYDHVISQMDKHLK